MSSHKLFGFARVRQYKDLCGKDDDDDDASGDEEVLDNKRELKDFVGSEFDPRDPKYHVIRTKLGSSHITTKSNIEEIFGSYNYNYCSYHGNGDIDDLNKTLSTEPDTHTIVFILETKMCQITC